MEILTKNRAGREEEIFFSYVMPEQATPSQVENAQTCLSGYPVYTHDGSPATLVVSNFPSSGAAVSNFLAVLEGEMPQATLEIFLNEWLSPSSNQLISYEK
jgi:hypothetical protein